MEIKVGQWVRTSNGTTAKVFKMEISKLVCVNLEGITKYVRNGKVFSSPTCNFVYTRVLKVADTPQELIQVGDLYELTSNFTNRKQIFEATENDSIFKIIKNNSKDIELLTKIFTPNKDKSVYTLQWEQTKGA